MVKVSSETGGTRVNELKVLLAEEMVAVDALIVEKIQSHVPLASSVAQHMITAGGKRLRPLLCLAAVRLFGGERERAIKLATCLEFIHNATLLHDDVIDESSKRHGKSTANDVWGNKPAVLVGDFLFARSFELMVQLESLPVLDILSKASATMSLAEVLQLSFLHDLSMGEEDYFSVINGKTAILFEAATEAGAVLCGATKDEKEAIQLYGRQLGMVFQLTDDLLDYSPSGTPGKETGDDFREGKITLPVILAYNKGSQEQKDFWQRVIVEQDQQEGDFEQAQQFLKELNIFEHICKTIEHRKKEALAQFDKLPESDVVPPLAHLLSEIATRASSCTI